MMQVFFSFDPKQHWMGMSIKSGKNAHSILYRNWGDSYHLNQIDWQKWKKYKVKYIAAPNSFICTKGL